MSAWFKRLLDSDDRNADEMAFMAVAGIIVYLYLSIYAVVWDKRPFDPQAYGIGLGSAIGAAAVGVGARRKLDPGKDR